MSMWTAIALIAMVSIIAGAWSKKSASSETKAVADLNERLDSLDRELKERIETLERIVTDDKEDLKRQFDHLDKAG